MWVDIEWMLKLNFFVNLKNISNKETHQKPKKDNINMDSMG